MTLLANIWAEKEKEEKKKKKEGMCQIYEIAFGELSAHMAFILDESVNSIPWNLHDYVKYEVETWASDSPRSNDTKAVVITLVTWLQYNSQTRKHFQKSSMTKLIASSIKFICEGAIPVQVSTSYQVRKLEKRKKKCFSIVKLDQ